MVRRVESNKKPTGQSWKRNNRSVDRDDAVDGKFKTNAVKQGQLRDKILNDPEISRGVTVTGATGHRWTRGD